MAVIPAHAARPERRELVIQGVALDRNGRPLEGARIHVTGDLETNAIAGPDGRFAVTLRLGTVEDVRQRPLRFNLDARARGKRMSVSGGPASVDLLVRGSSAPGGGIEVVSNVPGLGESATQILQVPKQSLVPVEVAFSTSRGRSEAPPNLARRAPPAPAPPRLSMPKDPVARAADSLLDFREPGDVPPPATPRAEAGEPETSDSRAPGLAPAPVAGGASSGAARQGGAGPRIAPSDTARRTPASREPRRSREPPSALEILDAARRRGTILAGESRRESLRTLDQRHERGRNGRDDGRLANGLNDSDERGRHGRDERRLANGLTEPDERVSEPPRHDRLLVSSRTARGGSRDDATFFQHRRDSVMAAMRRRDSLNTLARAMDRIREQDRQDSVRAARQGPRLDRRVPVGGRVSTAREETNGDRPEVNDVGDCYCNVEGTIEVRSNRPLSAPFGVTVAVRGRPTLRDRVLLYMGAPREFVIGRVPCGTRYLDVMPEPGRQFYVERSRMLGPFDCESGMLRQIRIVLVPR